MHGCVNYDFPQDLRHAILSKLFAFVHWITSRDIYMDSIPRWHREIGVLVCMFDKELSTSFMDLQVHILIHLPNEVELYGVLSCRWMFFLERYMKKLKGFIRQREKLEGCIVYESFYYESKYIKQIDDIAGAGICDDHQDEEKI
jgi:hypothetical protein